jgi:hypothetical protein
MRFGPRERIDAFARAWTVTAFGAVVLALVALVSEHSHAAVVARAWQGIAPTLEAAMSGFAL